MTALGRVLLLPLLVLVPQLSAHAQQPAPLSTEALSELQFRSVGPAVMGGRIHDVEARPGQPSTIYAATASGGLWKTTDKGTTWEPLFDDQPVSTFGDVELAPSNRQVVWAGTGEQNNRQSTSWGNGVYRSTDGGQTWTHLGLVDTRHVGRIQVHPKDPDVAYVAALGNLWAPSSARGVYKTTDGGKTWERVLFVNKYTGAVDLAMHPTKPDVLYVAMYQRLRRTWGFNGGGPGSGIYKTTDGGETWTELTDGIPKGDKGRIGLATTPADPDRVYALVQHAEKSGTYRSDDAGASWTKVNDLDPRPMYYSHIVADPTDAGRVFVLATEFYMSEDAGKTFTRMPTRPSYDVGVHSDHHTLWIDPGDPEHFYLAGDAGLHESWDRGQTYRRINNLPIGQFYAIGTDMHTPYRIYGGMQDNHSWMGPSETRRWKGIIDDDWKEIGFGDGMYQQVAGPRTVFVGSQNGGLNRVDPLTGDNMQVGPVEPKGADYRFDWVTPSHVSRFDSSTVYFGGNRLFISRDKGNSWTRTKDLTKDIERDSLSLMGVPGYKDMLSKHDGTASYSEITTIAESPLTPDILWVGTDDGNVQVSRDGGASWTEVGSTIDAVGDTTYVSRVLASRAGRGVAYVTLDGHRHGDFSPYLFKTTDFGQTWTKLTDGLTQKNAGTVNVIVEHPDNPNVLFLGTEHALFVSTTAGRQWTEVESGLPTTLYDDLRIHPREKDLVVGTHGRSLWILDDTTPIAEWSASVKNADAHLFSIQPATLHNFWKNTSYRGQAAWAGENPPFGALISYYLGAPTDSVELIVRNTNDEVVRRLSGPSSTGKIHRVAWDLTYPPPPIEEDEEGKPGIVEPDTVLPELEYSLEPKGPFVRPGTYTVTLRAGDARDTQTVEVKEDPKVDLTADEWRERQSFLLDVLDAQRSAFRAAQRADSLHERLRALAEDRDASDELTALVDTAETRAGELQELQFEIYDLAGVFNWSGVTQPSLRPPAKTHRRRFGRLGKRLRAVTKELEALAEDARPYLD